jgi:acetolactate synthase regulatory subunit
VKETGNVDMFRHLGFRVVAEEDDDLLVSDKFEKLIDVEMVKQLPYYESK